MTSLERGGDLKPHHWREREVHHRRRERTSNHTVGEGREARTLPPDRGGKLDQYRRRGK
jgi:hypothetical protein